MPEDECTRREAYEGNFEGRKHQLAIQPKQQFHERSIPTHLISFEAFDCKPTRYQLPDINKQFDDLPLALQALALHLQHSVFVAE